MSLSKLFYFQPLSEILVEISRVYQKKTNAKKINEKVTGHPSYPSLLTASDVLFDLGINSMGVKVESNQIHLIPCPAVVHIKEGNTYSKGFGVLLEVSETKLTLFDPSSRKKTNMSIEEFKGIFLRSALILTEEPIPTKEVFWKNGLSLSHLIARLDFLILLLFFLLYTIISPLYFDANVLGLILSITSLIGILATAILLSREVDNNSEIFKQICGYDTKRNCSSVLASSGATIFGISWGIVGFAFFVTSFLLLIISGIYSKSLLTIICWMNILATPYVAYSLLYQYLVVKQWCRLCLMVQGVIVIQFGLSLTNGSLLIATADVFAGILIATLLFTTVICASYLLVGQLKKLSVQASSQKELYKIKQDLQVFTNLLEKNNPLVGSIDGISLTLGNPNGPIQIVKVCNPYCGPCSISHKFLEQIIEDNNDICLKIIFTAKNDDKDKRVLPVRHFLNLNSYGNSELVRNALNFWYNLEEKDINLLKEAFPIKEGNQQNYGAEIEAMSAWCSNNDIKYTPTLYVGGFRLPDIYSINDLKYLLRSEQY